MTFLLQISRLVDAVNARIGRTTYWLVLIVVVISAGNATVRYAFSRSSNAWLEVQWYLFSAIFLLCAAYTLLRNEHIRIDIVGSRLSRRTQDVIELIGHLAFLMPLCLLIIYEAWPYFMLSFRSGEMSGNAGGLIRWPVKLLIVVGFGLLFLQGVSELVKRVAAMRGLIPDPHAGKTGSR